MVEACDAYRGRDGARKGRAPDGHFQRWADRYDWRARATAYDDHLDALARAEIEPLQVRTIVDVRRQLLESAPEVAASLLSIARGTAPPENARVRACEAVLARCGVVETKGLDVTSMGESLAGAWSTARRNIDEMTDDELASYLAASRSSD